MNVLHDFIFLIAQRTLPWQVHHWRPTHDQRQDSSSISTLGRRQEGQGSPIPPVTILSPEKNIYLFFSHRNLMSYKLLRVYMCYLILLLWVIIMLNVYGKTSLRAFIGANGVFVLFLPSILSSAYRHFISDCWVYILTIYVLLSIAVTHSTFKDYQFKVSLCLNVEKPMCFHLLILTVLSRI